MTIEQQSKINHRQGKPVVKNVQQNVQQQDEGAIEMCAALPPQLVEAVNHYLDAHPRMSWDDAVTVALSLLVMQNGHSSRAVNKTYLEGMFGGAA